MIDKNKINELLQNKDYDSILNLLEKDYFDLLQIFLENKNITIKENSTIADLILLLKVNFPQYKGTCIFLNNAILSDELDTTDRINTLLDGYEDIYKLLN